MGGGKALVARQLKKYLFAASLRQLLKSTVVGKFEIYNRYCTYFNSHVRNFSDLPSNITTIFITGKVLEILPGSTTPEKPMFSMGDFTDQKQESSKRWDNSNCEFSGIV